MENIVNVKRKAQKLVQEGNYTQAIEQYTLIVESGDMDPYDHVVLGDLLLRDSRKEEAIDRYQEALTAYSRGGLVRNAIALAKRIRRLAPGLSSVQRQLGDLYAAEGFHTEAVLHYMEYLDRAKGESDFGESAEEVARKLLDLPLPSFELVPRIVSVLEETGRAKALAAGVLHQARRAGQFKHTRVEETLHDLALSLDPEIEQHAPSTRNTGIDPGVVRLDVGDFAGTGPSPAVPRGADTQEYHDPSAVELPSSGASTPSWQEPDVRLDDEPGAAGAHVYSIDDAEAPGVVSLEALENVPSFDDAAGDGENGQHVIAIEEEGNATPPPADEDPEEVLARGERALQKGDVLVAQREFMRAGGEYHRQGDLRDAERVYRNVVRLDPNHIEALRHLVEIAHAEGDLDKMARHGCELGDVFLARERYEDARVQFERVLSFDPANAKAQSRLNRLHSIIEQAGTEDELRVADEVEHSRVTIRDDAPAPTQTSMDLAAILEEFRSAVVGNIPAEDSQAHYDMGMAYIDMDLIEDAMAEFELAAEDGKLRTRALEMIVECYLLRQRGPEALEVLNELFSVTTGNPGRARLHVLAGRARETEESWVEAEREYHRALDLEPDLGPAVERLQALERRRTDAA